MFDYFLQSTSLGWICFLFCSRAFRCAVKLLVYALPSFFLEAFRTMSFPLSTAFITSFKLGYLVLSFSLNLKKFKFLFLFLPWPSYHWVGHCSASMCMCAFYCFCWYLRPGLVCGDLRGYLVLFQSFCIWWGLFYDWLYGQFWRSLHEVLRRGFIFWFGDEMFCRYLLNPFDS